MIYRNGGSSEPDILQNKFTAYILTAIRREKLAYLKNRFNRLKIEIELEEYHLNIVDNSDIITELGESDSLSWALRNIKEKERYIFLARALYEKSFSQIANELGMKYKGVASVYYRTIAKLRALIGGESK